MELFSSNIKKFQEMETTKKTPYISGNGNPKKTSFISENGTFQSYASGNIGPKKIPYVFSKERFFYISENGNPGKIVIFQETELIV